MARSMLAGLVLALMLPGCAESAAPGDTDGAMAEAASSHGPVALALAAVAGGKTALRVERVIDQGLRFPTAIASPRDGSGRLFVLERDGRVRILDRDGKLQPEPYYDRTVTTDDIEQGLLGFAFDPAFRDNGRLYIAYNGAATGEQWGMVLRRLEARDPAANRFAGDDDVLMRVPGLVANHNGGDLHFGPDGMLYWSIGAGTGQAEEHAHARSTDSLLGKILRIDVRTGASGERNRCGERGSAPYAIPADNPFAGRKGECGEIWLYGLRNPWRFDIDPSNGEIWIGDVGVNREEITRFRPGEDARDLGFPACQGSDAWPQTGATDCPAKTGSTPPLYEYAGGDHGRCAITGGVRYRGAIAALKGAYVFSDSCSSELLVGRLSAGGMLEVESIDSGIAPGYGTIASFGEDEDNELWFVNHENGGVYRIR